VARRRMIAASYDRAFRKIEGIQPLSVVNGVTHAYHLYVVRVTREGWDRGEIFRALRREGIGVNVHYIPVHLHPFYRTRFNTGPGLCPVAEAAYQDILSLPIFPRMEDQDIRDVITAVEKVVAAAV